MAKAGVVQDPKFIEGATFVLKSVPVKWAKVQEDNPDTMFERCWKLDAVLDKPLADSMIAAGFNVHEKDGEYLLSCKTKCATKAGKPNKPPVVVGRDGKTPFTREIGNGSICNVKVYAKFTTVSGKTYLPAYLNAVQVVDHVEYNGAGFDSVDDEDTDVPF